MNRSVVLVGCMLMAGLAASAQAQCQRGGGSQGSQGMMGGQMASGRGMMSGGMMGNSMGSSNPWAYAQLQSQAIARQAAMQAYQKKMEDQARRADSLAKRQYWAAQRRQQKTAEGTSPGNQITGNQLAANFRAGNSGGSGSSGSSLDIVPRNR